MSLGVAKLILIYILVINGIFNVKSDKQRCLDLLRRVRLERSTQTLDIDELIYAYHLDQDWDVAFFVNRTQWTYTIDLSCLESVNKIESAKRRSAKHFYLTRFTTEIVDSNSGYLNLNYFISESNSSKMTARFFITQVYSIKTLTLSYNRYLLEFPDLSFHLLRGLTKLDLSKNGKENWDGSQSSDERLNFHSSTFAGLEELTHLDLSSNPSIAGTLDSLCVPKELTHLDLSFTFAYNLYSYANTIDCFQKLKLFNNTIKSQFLRSLGYKAIELWTSLQTLDLSGVLLDFRNEFENETLIFRNVKLRELKFEIWQDFEGIFMLLNELESLDISHKMPVLSVLKNSTFLGLSNLTYLRMSNHKLTVFNIDDAVFLETPILVNLDMSANQLEKDVINKLFCLNKTLEKLNLEDNKIELLEEPWKELWVLSQLRKLNLGQNTGVDLSVSHFRGLKQLRRLVLSSDFIDRLIVQSFTGLEELQDLDLSNNFIRFIENGTFASIPKLTRLNLRQNDLKNLFFFGLSTKCEILFDGLLVFNISLIDLKEMTDGRQDGFVVKQMHLKGSTVSIYRNIRVDWKSASARPNCSLYFHVLRHFKPISFELEPIYLDECLSEDLIFSPDQATFLLNQANSIKGHATSTLKLKSANITDLAANLLILDVIDGYLIGVDYQRKELMTLRSNATQIEKFVLKIDENDRNFSVACDTVLKSFSTATNAISLWNMTDKTNIRRSTVKIINFHFSHCLVGNIWTVVVGKEDALGLFYGMNFDRLSLAYTFKSSNYPNFILVNGLLVSADSQSIICLNPGTNPVSLLELVTQSGYDRIVSHLVSGPNGYFLGITLNNEAQVFKLDGNVSRIIWIRYHSRILTAVHARIFSNNRGDDSFFAFYVGSHEGQIEIWSGRFGKRIDRLPFPESGFGQLLSSDESSLFSFFYCRKGSIWFF